MTINSVVFVFGFMPLLLIAYYAVSFLGGKATLKKILLLAASILFYAWTAFEYLPLLLGIVVINYLAALRIKKLENSRKKALLAAAVTLNVFVLFFYKYFDFFGNSLSCQLGFEFQEMGLVQPLGISFFTFSQISYLVDVYRETVNADKNLLNVALWSCFFPKITSGPIVRYADMNFDGEPSGKVNLESLAYGARRFVIGLGKKTIIADSLGIVVDSIFTAQATTGIDTPTAWLGILCYTLQIFFDFSGYSDMAIGLAAMFGYRFKENFLYPYTSLTLGEFWHRWHISLSSQLRDYLYFPLGGSRRGNVYVNLMIVMLVSGLWHGADWHYVIWGAWYGFFMIIDRLYRLRKDKVHIPKAVLWFATIMIVVIGWVFFRSADIAQSLTYIAALFGGGVFGAQFHGFGYYFNAQLVFLMAVGILCSTPIFSRMREKFEETPAWNVVRLVGIPLLFAVSVLYMVNSTYSPFLYAQF